MASSATSKSQYPELIFGGGTMRVNKTDAEEGAKMLDILEKYGVRRIDTANGYGAGGNEKLLAETGATKRFIIDTKPLAYTPGDLKYEKVLESMARSLENLQMGSVNAYIIHGPDRTTPISETMDALQKLYLEGKFKELGISNFTLKEVEEAYEYAKSKGYVLPTRYQGNYNPLTRQAETKFLPRLRELGICWDAYSPIAGGFLARDRAFFDNVALQEGTRWHDQEAVGKLYKGLYFKPSMLNALDEWGKLAEQCGLSKAMLAYTWLKHHSAMKAEYGDGYIFGVKTTEQMEEVLKGLQESKPLPQFAVDKIDEIWEMVRDDAPSVEER